MTALEQLIKEVRENFFALDNKGKPFPLLPFSEKIELLLKIIERQNEALEDISKWKKNQIF